jgi:AhpD family alkylhydroperoxidase
MSRFAKRTFTLPLLGKSLGAAAITSPVMLRALVKPRLPASLREEVMLAVTSVNDCRYCSWVHTGLALENGVDMEDLGMLLGKSLDNVEEREAVAILFGKHFADTVRQPSAQARAKLAAHFSPAEQREIMAYIHAIYFANLTGNSADAILARLRGQQVEGSIFAQLLAAIVGAPVLWLIWLASRRNETRPMPE